MGGRGKAAGGGRDPDPGIDPGRRIDPEVGQRTGRIRRNPGVAPWMTGKRRKDRPIGTTDREVAPHRGRRGQEVGQINGGREKKIQLRIVLILFVCCINFRESSSILKGRLYCQSMYSYYIATSPQEFPPFCTIPKD